MTDYTSRSKQILDRTNRRRFECIVPPTESLGEIVRRVRSVRATDIVLNISNHPVLRRDGSLRRTIVSAAEQRGKKVTFSMSGTNEEQVVPVAFPRQDVHKSMKGGPRRRIAIAVQSHDSKKIHNAPVVRVGGINKTIVMGFLVASIILIVVAVAIFSPSASVHITPSTQPISRDITLNAKTDTHNLRTNEVSANIVSEEIEVEEVFSVLQKEQRGNRSEGFVRVINRTASEQQIKSGSRLVNEEGIVVVMKGPAFIQPQSSVVIPAVADKGGEVGNVASGRFDFVALNESSRLVVYAEVAEAFSGGTDVFVHTVSEEDIARATDEIRANHKEVLDDALTSHIPDDVFSASELQDIVVQNIRTVPDLGSEANEFRLSATLVAKAFLVTEEDILDSILSVVFADTGEDVEFVHPIDSTAWSIHSVDWNRETAVLKARIDNIAYPRFDTKTLSEQLAERTAESAEAFLSGIPGVVKSEVKLSPFWVKRVPRFSRNIDIVMDIP